ncbi:Broad specificity phosphatase PhoE [Pseudobutyrivibrio sp. UC1225]|uniref:histidine phosphatase family protein n=1 Tax=Pseudobutyrivibrio sp. UC1225 TaxID=1798185 RepID=UPI0008E2DAF4|nr:histidine phosphatase family protein [Pseudobutyrivibrio sp. UC1225]SFN97186.1 Broad specificity phosphatase PhoE [Pseudobutyrivibrio sp. UC1225]
MIFLMRHGEDDNTRLGGWSDAGLSVKGREQVERACDFFDGNSQDIRYIFASDLQRAKDTADIVSKYLDLPVTQLKEFRETNNGDLAGMPKERFQKEYPGLYYASLDWEQKYPNGESPKDFYNRIKEAWGKFKVSTEALEGNVLLVTHAGVINIIRCIEEGVQYTNKEVHFKTGHAEIVSLNRNVIFLDVDGVLNSKFWDNEHQREISEGKYVDVDSVKLFSKLVKKTNAKVILHSGWRFWFDDEMKPNRAEAKFFADVMEKEGVFISGVTPDLTTEEIRKAKKFSLVKAGEILQWLKDNPTDNWLVIDDLDLQNSEIASHQVKTDAEVGLTENDVEKALNLLLG